MTSPVSIGYFSPFLSEDQKNQLQELERALTEQCSESASDCLRNFLELSFEATREAILELHPELNLATLEQLSGDEGEEAQVLTQVLWNGETLSPFAQGLLAWHTRMSPNDSLGLLSIDQLKNYLVASADFYNSRRGLFPEHAAIPLCEPPPVILTGFDLPEEETVEEAELAPPEAEADQAAGAPDTGPENEAACAETQPETESTRPYFAEELVSQTADQPLNPRGTAPAAPARAPAQAADVEPTSQDDLELVELSRAPLSPLEAQSQLVVKKKYLGYGKNSDGVMGYCGQLTLSRFDDKTLTATLQSSNPLLFLSASSVNARSTVITYWMPPAAFPQPGGHLAIESPEGKKVLSVSSLFPQSRTDFLRGRQVAALLLAPALLGMLYFGFVYLYSSYSILSQVQQLFPQEYAAALSGQGTAHFRAQGVGLYQLEVVPASESLQLIVASMIWLAPLASTKFFRHLSSSRKRAFGGLLAAALVLPSLSLMVAWTLQRRLFPIFEHPDFSPLDLRGFLPWALPLNLAVAGYLFFSVHGLWDRKLPSNELRLLLPVALGLAYLATCFLLIFGRSWMS